MKEIILAGGCFWGIEEYYKRLKGVETTVVGYVNGNIDNPRYEDLINQTSTHAESVKLRYDETVISLDRILENLFKIIDPTSLNKQGNDVGLQYRSGIYYFDKADKKEILNFLKKKAKEYKKPLVIEAEEVANFYDAEIYHQNYLVKYPYGYCHVDFSVMDEDEKK